MKVAGKYHEIEIMYYDVWGNEEDGWEVNNVHRHYSGELFVDDSVWNDDQELCRLAANELGFDNLSDDGFELDGDERVAYINHNGCPLCEVHIVKTVVDMDPINA